MEIKGYLDATYLKTPEQLGLNNQDYLSFVQKFVQESIDFGFKLVMIRPQVVQLAKKLINNTQSSLLVGTVIGFPEGTHTIQQKLKEAQQAIDDGADELDFVCNYTAFINGDLELVKEEILKGTQLGLSNKKTVKWIIEVAALTPDQIIQISVLIKKGIMDNFHEKNYQDVFVKSSTGFFQTTDNKPNGATSETIKMMIENAFPLPVKAAGGVKNLKEAKQMIALGVQRIGTSSAVDIIRGLEANCQVSQGC